MYLLLEGKHPLYESGVDNASSYIEKLKRFNPSKWTTTEHCSKFTTMALDLFTKLCNPMPMERYTAE